jgi:ketosteroid isomerase-like protein
MTDPTAVIRRLYDAIARADLDTFNALIADDVAWHVAGSSPVAGTHTGRGEIVAVLMKIFEATGGTMHHEILDVLGAGDTGVAVYRATAEGRSGPYDAVDITRFRLADGVVVEAWEHPFDQTAFDGLTASANLS